MHEEDHLNVRRRDLSDQIEARDTTDHEHHTSWCVSELAMAARAKKERHSLRRQIHNEEAKDRRREANARFRVARRGFAAKLKGTTTTTTTTTITTTTTTTSTTITTTITATTTTTTNTTTTTTTTTKRRRCRERVGSTEHHEGRMLDSEAPRALPLEVDEDAAIIGAAILAAEETI